MEIPDIYEKIVQEKEKKIKRVRIYTNRASIIGYFLPSLGGCVRLGVYERTHWNEKKLNDVNSQFVFDEGKNQEQQVLKDLMDAGFKIIKQQTPFEIIDPNTGEVLLSGTLEGELVISEEAGHTKDSVLIEIKSMNPNIYHKINEPEDFKKYSWTTAYIGQIMSYMMATGRKEALFILKDKSNGTIKQVKFDIDINMVEEIQKVSREINHHVKNNTLPNKLEDIDKCLKCNFLHVCRPGINIEKGPKVADDPLLESKIDRWMELKDTKKEVDNLYKESISPKIKATADGKNVRFELGKYFIKGTYGSNGSFRPTITLKVEKEDED